ncbi:hypothetical protein EJ06DRAFT_537938 [Trichodelitschia bisporula]|uniref:SWIRM domain-containing protein n=1 Tax=Trichodelitschia bisporula TaxID=703511 RepID=A0A6G1HWC6_9PEZI|nr:hypothetical protein EJ06DRAFT_537938 [Trichodelitschia bisporula]
MSWPDFAWQGIQAAYASRLNPFALHPLEYQLLREHITRPQVTIYLNIRNAILRLWHSNPLAAVGRHEAAGCARDPRYFQLAIFAFEFLIRHGYINHGCVELPNTARSISRSLGMGKGVRRRPIVIIGAGMAGLSCARHLEGLFFQLGEQFTRRGERPPKIILLEGRKRIGGRVFSRPLAKQGNLPDGLRSTAETGAMVVMGFNHGNPMNVLIRGQLGLRYHILRDTEVLYDYDGTPVDKNRDHKVQTLYDNLLDRVAGFRNPLVVVPTVAGDQALIQAGLDAKEVSQGEDAQVISQLQDAGIMVTVNDGSSVSNDTVSKEHASTGVEKSAGRQYQRGKPGTKLAASEAAKDVSGSDSPSRDPSSIELRPCPEGSQYPTLGHTMDNIIDQYQRQLNLTPQDLRLFNWHHANMEYANAAHVDHLSLSGWDQGFGNEFEGGHCLVVGGYTQVSSGLYSMPFKLDVRVGHAVKSVVSRETKQDEGYVTIQCENGESFEAERVVVTTPLGVLKEKRIQFRPELPEWKLSCIDRMGFGLLNKVILVYDEPFWEAEQDFFGLLNAVEDEDDPYNTRNYANNRGRYWLFWNAIQTSGRPMLIALMAGDAAHATEITPDAVLIKEATARLSRVFPHKNVPPPKEVLITRWKRDPFTRGSYSYNGPRSQHGDYELMAQRIGPLHFAGEHTCAPYPATVHGAYLSGLRAANEVIEELLGPIAIPTPLVPLRHFKAEAAPTPATPEALNLFPLPTGTKRKKGYVDVWEPIHAVPAAGGSSSDSASSSLQSQAEAYEARIIGAILAELGERPIKPSRSVANPFLEYQKDSWYRIKAQCDAERAATTGNPNARAGRDEIRTALGLTWRTADEAVKRPYVERAEKLKRGQEAATRAYLTGVELWDREAARIRREFMQREPPAEEIRGLVTGGTAIEVGGGSMRAKGRKGASGEFVALGEGGS